jgi:hypothetical protein
MKKIIIIIWWFLSLSSYSQSILIDNNLDKNAKSYCTASGITTLRKIGATSQFVRKIKVINKVQTNFVRFDTLSKSVLKAVYPWIVGTTFNTRKFNLISPTTDTTSYILNEYGSFTYNANYVQSNGTNARFDTHYIPDNSRLDHHFLAYFRGESAKAFVFGGCNNYEFTPYYAGNSNGNNLTYGYCKTQGVGIYDMISPNGLIGFNQPTGSTNHLMWINNSKYRGEFQASGGAVSIANYSAALFARRLTASSYTYANFKSSFVSMGWGISERAYQKYNKAVEILHRYCQSYESVTWPYLGERSFVQPIENNYYRSDMPSIINIGTNSYIIAWGAFPNVQTGDGSTCYIESKQTSDDFSTLGNHIKIYRSTTNGGFGTDISDMIPSLYKQNSGNTICICLVKLTTTTSELRIVKSINNGLTWSSGTKIYGEPSKYYAPKGNSILKTNTGRLLYPFAENTGGGSLGSQTGYYTTKLIYSDDDGETWSLMAGVAITSPDNLAVEPGCLQKPDNTIVVYFRTRSGTVYAANSTDNGVTFGASYNTNLKAPDATSCIIYSARISKYIAVHNFRINFASGASVFGGTARTLLRCSTSTDFSTWTKFTDIDELYNYYMFEPCIQDLGNQFIIAYSRANYNESLIDLVFKKINIQ